MPLLNNMDDELFDSDVVTLVGEPLPGMNSYIIDRDVYEVKTYPGTTMRMKYLLFPRGRQITETQYQYMLNSATDDPVPEV